MATDPDDEVGGGSRLWRGMRALIFGDEAEPSLRDQIEDAMDEAEGARPVTGDLSAPERLMLRNLLHFGDRTAGEIAVTLKLPRGTVNSRLRRGLDALGVVMEEER